MNKLERASEFLIQLCKKFDQLSIKYLLVRNFYQYPTKITGDIDFVITTDNKDKLNAIFETLVFQEGWIILKKVSYPFLIGFLIFDKNKSSTRKFLAFDFFVDFTYRSFYLQNFDSLYEKHTVINNFRCLDRANYAWMTYLHYFFFKGCIPTKYREDIYNVVIQDRSKFDSKYIPNVCLEYFVNDIKKNGWRTNSIIRFIFITSILVKNLIHDPLNSIQKIFKLFLFYLSYFFNPSQYIVILKTKPQKKSCLFNLSSQLINYIHKYHLFSKMSSIIPYTHWYFTLVKIIKIICFRGLPIVEINEKEHYPLIEQLLSVLGFQTVYLEIDDTSIILTKKIDGKILSTKNILNNLPLTENCLTDISEFILL